MALVRARGDEELRTMADRHDGLLLLEERLDEGDRRLLRAEPIRREPTWDEQCVELIRAHLGECFVDDRGLSPLVSIQPLTGLHADDRDLVCRLLLEKKNLRNRRCCSVCR